MKQQHGFTLVEVMVASVIGVFLLAGMMNLFITTNKSVSLNDGLSQNQETGRFAMEYITQFARMAGYSSEFTNEIPGVAIASSDFDCTVANFCSENDLDTVRGDRLAIPFATAAGETLNSCTGNVVGDAVNNRKFVSVFWVSLNEDNSDKELRCQTYEVDVGWIDNPVSIVSNVEQMHFQVGLAEDADTKQAGRYVNVDPINTFDLNLIRSIRVGLLTTSENELDEDKRPTDVFKRKYTVLDGPTLTVEDGNFRHIFTTTVELPNAIESTN